MSAQCLENETVEERDQWVSYIRDELRENRNRLEQLMREIQAGRDAGELRTQGVIVELHKVEERLDAKIKVNTDQLHTVQLDVVRLQGRAGIWTAFGVVLAAVATALWYVLGGKKGP